MSICNRVSRLERAAPWHGEGPCPWEGVTVLADAGQPPPADAGACPVCGGPHILSIEEVVEGPTEEPEGGTQ
jgi:hypothetical protein